MRRRIAVVMCSAVLGLMTLSSHAVAQQKTAKECRDEWRANKAANQASGVTEKAYVAQCRGEAAPTAAPARRLLQPLLPQPRLQDKRLRRNAGKNGGPIKPPIRQVVSRKKRTWLNAEGALQPPNRQRHPQHPGSSSRSFGGTGSTCANTNGSRASGQTSSPCNNSRQTGSQHSCGSRRGEPIFSRSTG